MEEFPKIKQHTTRSLPPRPESIDSSGGGRDSRMSAVGVVHPFEVFFFFNDTATTEIYTLSLHDALPIFGAALVRRGPPRFVGTCRRLGSVRRSEEHTSELQSHHDLVCRLLLEKKKHNTNLNAPNVAHTHQTNNII